MVKKVMVPMFEASDGQRFASKALAQLHEWRENPVNIDAIDVAFKGVTRDLHGNRWTWSCGRCKTPARTELDTMFRRTSACCETCSADNLFDFSKFNQSFDTPGLSA